MRLLKEYGGAFSFCVLVLAATFYLGARWGQERTIAAVRAQIEAARATSAKKAPEPPGPKSGTVRRVVGDQVVSETPVEEKP